MVRRTKAEAEATRHQILDAAERVFRARGVSRTSLQDIAGEAGVTRGAIYWHFRDKAEVYMAMMDRVCLPCESEMCLITEAAQGDPLGHLVAMAYEPLHDLLHDAHIQQVFHVAMHCTEFTEELAPVRARRQEAIGGYLAMMEAVLVVARSQGLVRQDVDVAAAAAGLFAMVDGLMRNGTLEDPAFNLARVGRPAIEAYVQGLRPTASRPDVPETAPRKTPARPARSTSAAPRPTAASADRG